ncbi:MAG: 50S ribosomal protein L29 [Sedimentisphaerales bacterium]|nr:50S ribosomal protein L29 [Sedimentisphaerales bacterium]
MKAAQLRELRDDELTEKLDELQKRLFELRVQSVTEKMEDTCAKRNVRRDIARVRTIIKERQRKGR